MTPRTRRLLLPEVADRLRITVRKVQGLIAAGQLSAIDISTTPGSKRPRYVVDEADLAAFEERRRTGPAARPAKVRRDAVPNYFAGASRG